MELHKTLDINLSKYGKTGLIVMSRPTFRRRTELKNAIGSMMKVSRNEYEEQTIQNDHAGDLQIIGILAYIESAPFPPTLDGFLNFCDQLDAINVDYAEELFLELQDIVKRIDGGELSPFVPSTDSVTGSSD